MILSEHYYSENPQSKSSPKTWDYRLRGHLFSFTSDVGVFSKNEVDFGSRLLIEKFEEPAVSGDILDLGCGYGPIGLSLAKSFPDRRVTMADVNDRALILAKENAKQNNIDNVEILQSDGFSNLGGRRFAAVATNPPIRAGKKVYYPWFDKAQEALLEGGELWAVIQKKQGAPSLKTKLMEVFGNAEIAARDKGYYVFLARKV